MTDPIPSPARPQLDWLTRDYPGYRALLVNVLDRSDTAWRERSAADLGMMLVEALSYQLDHLAYAGDRVAAEGFLSTAVRRESVRRLAALGDHRLDRGSTSIGLQYFRVSSGSIELPAGTRISTPLEPGEDPEHRTIFETLQDVEVDVVRNELYLEMAAGEDSRVLWLAGADSEPVDLWALGFRPGMRLILTNRYQVEAVTIATIQGSLVGLEQALQNTWLAGTGERSTTVLGNIVPIRRGETSAWAPVGRGGVTRDEVEVRRWFQLRLELIRRLRNEAETARPFWQKIPRLLQSWVAAIDRVTLEVRRLRETSAGSLDEETATGIDQRLEEAAAAFRALIEAAGLRVPTALRPSRRVTLPHQTLKIDSTLPLLWFDDAPTLEVSVGVAEHWTSWQEVENFLTSRSDDLHYRVELDRNGFATLQFGDGRHGAMLPAGSHVLARWVSGDPTARDFGPGALTQLLDPVGDSLDPVQPTTNPAPVGDTRPPEHLEGVPARIRMALEQPVVPVTAADHVRLVEALPDVAEAMITAVSASPPRVEVVVRPSANAPAQDVMASVRETLESSRLAGSWVDARLPRPLFVALGAVLDVHPEMSPADVKLRVRQTIREHLTPVEGRQLGQKRTRAGVLGAIETVSGVTWSEVVVFDRASRALPGRLESINPASDQVVRCHDIPGRPASGTITLWEARRFHLQLVQWYTDPDALPDPIVLHGLLMTLVSGPWCAPVRERWDEITGQALESLFDRTSLLAGPGSATSPFTLRVEVLSQKERRVPRVLLGDGTVPIVESLQIVPRWKG